MPLASQVRPGDSGRMALKDSTATRLSWRASERTSSGTKSGSTSMSGVAGA
jgi:hypothetical protein